MNFTIPFNIIIYIIQIYMQRIFHYVLILMSEANITLLMREFLCSLSLYSILIGLIIKCFINETKDNEKKIRPTFLRVGITIYYILQRWSGNYSEQSDQDWISALTVNLSRQCRRHPLSVCTLSQLSWLSHRPMLYNFVESTIEEIQENHTFISQQ